MNNLELLQKAKYSLSNKDDELCKAFCTIFQHMIDAGPSELDVTIDNITIYFTNYSIDICENDDNIMTLGIPMRD